MAVSEADLSEIEKVISATDAAAPVFAELRRRFPGLSWTQCDAADVTESPFRTFSGFELHLLDTADHCPQVTLDLERATGIILARRSGMS